MRILAFITCLFCLQPAVFADYILRGMNFSQGKWAMVGVPLHNHMLVPIQKELRTFITNDQVFLADLQRTWNFEQTFDDKCDYHYALKFYQNNTLVRTFEINLYCGYITIEGMSYLFPAKEFERFRAQANIIPWSRISYADLQALQNAIFTLEKSPDVYWYDDVNPYKYPGFIMLGLDNLPWSSDMDSLGATLSDWIVGQTGRTEFYLKKHFHYLKNDRLHVRYLVNCHESLSWKLPPGTFLPWRSHLFNKDSVVILALGIDRQSYRRIVGD